MQTCRSVCIAVPILEMCRHINRGLRDCQEYETAVNARRLPAIMETMFHNIILNCVSETHQNLIQEEIKRRLNSGNACYHSVQNLLSSRLLSKNVKVRIYKTIILPVVLYGCETWSLTVREEHKLRVFENRVLSI
jgi:hypothetical protein